MKYFFLWVLSSIALPSCAAYSPQPLSLNHPAHADAPVAPRSALSQTLVYTRADAALPRSAAAAEPGGETVTAEGKVIAAVPSAAQLVVEHGKIEGFMDAMTMEFPVKSSADFAGLKVGDCINADVLVQDMDYWIGQIEKQSVAAGSCLALPAPRP